jgi:hypothetical protein
MRARVVHSLAPLGLIVLAAVGSCSQRPVEPVFENPFRPDGPDGGDPFHITAAYTVAGVVIAWSNPGVEGIKSYEVLHDTVVTGDYVPIAAVLPGALLSFIDVDYARYRDNYYKVRAVGDNQESALSRVAAARVFAPPEVVFPGDPTKVRTRYPRLSLRSDRGDEFELAATPDFVGSQRVPRTAARIDSVRWDLGPAPGNGTRKFLYARVWTGTQASPTIKDSTLVEFKPAMSVVSGPVIDSLVTIRVTTTGADSLRLARTHARLAAAPWRVRTQDSTTVEVVPVVLAASKNSQFILGQFRCDFGFGRVDSLSVKPLVVGTASFYFNNNDTLVSNPRVLVVSAVNNATQMRFWVAQDSAGVPWKAFDDSTFFTLSAGTGYKRVYGQYRNFYDPDGQVAGRTIHLVGGPAAQSAGPAAQSAGAAAVPAGSAAAAHRAASARPAASARSAVEPAAGSGLVVSGAAGSADAAARASVPGPAGSAATAPPPTRRRER